MSVKIVMGLGNFGAEYANTRHNVGMALLESLATRKSAAFAFNKYCGAYMAKIELVGKPLTLVHTDAYMNLSGECLAKFLKFLKLPISECAIVHDDINLPVGKMKLSMGGSSGGHNGIADIMQRCGNDFDRIRIGIGSKSDKRMDLADFVLGKLSAEDGEKIRAVDLEGCLSLLLAKGLEGAQNVINRKPDSLAQ